MRSWTFVALAAPLFIACHGNDSASEPSFSCADDGGCVGDAAAPPGMEGGAGADEGGATCAAREAVGDAGAPPPSSLYPSPRFSELRAFGAKARVACVDTRALASHAKIDALVATLLGEAGLRAGTVGSCECDWSIELTKTPLALAAAAASTWSAAGTAEDRYAIDSQAADGRMRTVAYAASERGALYALRAALSLGSADPIDKTSRNVAAGTIVDYPSFAWRGVVEGIYGPSTSNASGYDTYDCALSSTYYSPYRVLDRTELIRLMSDLRMNAFIYSPKCDLLARGDWATLYGTSSGQVISTAAHEAEKLLVKFTWGVSPGYTFDFNAYPAQLARMKAKLDQLRSLGVAHFALFWDDTNGSTTAAQQTTLMNDIDSYVKATDPKDHLIVIGQPYCGNTSGFCNGPTADSASYGRLLHPDIEIMWTGTGVEPSTMTAGDMTAANAAFRRKVTVWDNWPNGPGGYAGRDADLPKAVQGYYANPVLSEFNGPANPPRVFLQALGPIADYLWDSGKYAASAGSESSSYDRWQPILKSVEKTAGACAPCGAYPQYWSCKSGDPKSIVFCDPSTNCLTSLACPGGCETKPNPNPDICH